MLMNAGFINRGGKGSHSNWEHPLYPSLRITLSGNDGADAAKYHEVRVARAIKMVEGHQ